MVTDPRELTDLSHEPEHAARIASFEAELGRRFDLDGIAEKVRASYARRHVIRDAMRLAGTRWDYYPDSRSFNSYWQTL
jgi:choline-sulfatase